MGEVSWLLYRNQLLHLSLLFDLLKVDSVITLQTILKLSFLPQRSQVIDLTHSRLRHTIEHLLCLAAGTMCATLLIFLRLLLFHVLSTATGSFTCFLAVILIVSQREPRQKHHVGLVV